MPFVLMFVTQIAFIFTFFSRFFYPCLSTADQASVRLRAQSDSRGRRVVLGSRRVCAAAARRRAKRRGSVRALTLIICYDLKCFAWSASPVSTTFCHYLYIYIFLFLFVYSVDSDIAEACVARLLVRSLRVATGRSVPLHFWESVAPAPATAAVSGRQAQQHAEKLASKQPTTHGTSSLHRDESMHPAPQVPSSSMRPTIQNADLSTVLKRL